MYKELKDDNLTDHEKPKAASPKKDGDESSEKSRPAPRCPDNYCFEDGM